MTLRVTHSVVTGAAANPDVLVDGVAWDADHTVTGLGTGVETALAVSVGSTGSVVVNGGVLGTPSSGTLTNCTGLPVSSGVSGLGTGVATFLATPSSANLRAALTDEVGTGAAYFVGGALGTPASATLTNATGMPISGVTGLGLGQCRLALSGGNLVLSPLNGNLLTVNGAPCTIPDAGVSLSASGLSVGTTYNIYATASAGAVNALEASTTAHATSTTAGNKGTEIKSGDDARTLVGMARVVTGPAWVDSGSQRFVLSYFNRSGKNSVANSTTTRSVTNASLLEFNSELRAEFLTWADELVNANLVGAGYVGTANQAGFFAIGFDGTTAEPGMAAISDGTGGALRPVAFLAARRLSEGYHYATALGGGNASTSVNLYFSSASDGLRSSVLTVVRG